ncbi:MAG TPA: metal-dependent transcriptional regulator [Bacteroidia bacterium]|nr:metal-dependent transcriptional regulator [Bacteroidia bacterium]
MSSQTQENYLKCIYKICEKNIQGASTNAIAEELETKAATVTDMLKKLSNQKLINYKKYQAVTLTAIGKKQALSIVRNHRLWEVFLVEKLKFSWNEVHEFAEQLEHIKSDELIDRLDLYLGHPKFDPHGDPIPNKNGKIVTHKTIPLNEAKSNEKLIISGVSEHNDDFLSYLNETNLILGQKLVIKKINEYDKSMQLLINKKDSIFISHTVAKNILVLCQ